MFYNTNKQKGKSLRVFMMWCERSHLDRIRPLLMSLLLQRHKSRKGCALCFGAAFHSLFCTDSGSLLVIFLVLSIIKCLDVVFIVVDSTNVDVCVWFWGARRVLFYSQCKSQSSQRKKKINKQINDDDVDNNCRRRELSFSL